MDITSWAAMIGAGIALLLLLGKGGTFLSNAPAISSRLSPWLRLHPWWPVPAERRAETLLRDMLSQEEYRHLLTTGFLQICGPGPVALLLARPFQVGSWSAGLKRKLGLTIHNAAGTA
jgi:hypothetical protein